jgi:hypothetical protein
VHSKKIGVHNRELQERRKFGSIKVYNPKKWSGKVSTPKKMEWKGVLEWEAFHSKQNRMKRCPLQKNGVDRFALQKKMVVHNFQLHFVVHEAKGCSAFSLTL